MNELKKIRERLGLNQKEMAEHIGVSASYYYKVESRSQNPSYEFLKKIKKVFPNISIDKVFF